MKKFLGIFLLVLVLGTSVCFAEADIPNLVGTWTAQFEGVNISKGSEPGTWTHFRDGVNSLTAELVVIKQQGRVFQGIFTSPNATEKVAGVIGWDNKTVYFVDFDGFVDATLVNSNKMTYIYRHVGEKDANVAIGTYTRKK